MNVRTLVLAALLATSFVALVPSVEADTCHVVVGEEVVCPPVLATYCVVYSTYGREPVLDCKDYLL